MGKGCRLNGALACSKPGSTSNNNNNDNGGFPVQPAGDPRPECSTLSSAQSANPSASFSCVASSGKQETLSCTVNGVTNTFTGKKKKVISWATSSSCSSSSGGSSSGGSNQSTSGGSSSCNCQAEVANFLNIRVSRIQDSWLKAYDPGWKCTILTEVIRSFAKSKLSFAQNIRSFVWKYTGTIHRDFEIRWAMIVYFRFYDRMFSAKLSYSFSRSLTFSRKIVYFQSWSYRMQDVSNLLVYWQQCLQLYEQKWRNHNFPG